MLSTDSYPIAGGKLQMNVDPNDPWYGVTVDLRPCSVVSYVDDFMSFPSGNWTVTEVGTATQTIADEHGGVLLLTNSAADNDASTLQMGGTADGTTRESVLPASGRLIVMEARFKVSDATQLDFLFGLSVVDTTPLDSTNLVAFRKDDGDTNIDTMVGPTATGSQQTAVATADTSYHVYTIRIEGLDRVKFYIDGVLKATQIGSIPATEMAPTFTVQNGEAVAKTASIDYFAIVFTR